MTEQFLHGPDIIAIFEQMSSKRMSKCMTSSVFIDARPSHSFFHRPLDHRFVDVMMSALILYQKCLIMSSVFSDDEAEMRCEAGGWVEVVEAGEKGGSWMKR